MDPRLPYPIFNGFFPSCINIHTMFWGLGRYASLVAPCMGSSTLQHPGLSPAAKVISSLQSLALGQREGFSYE